MRDEEVLPLLLAHPGVHSNTGEVALAEQLVELVGTESALDKDNNLIELQAIEKLVELAVLLRFTQLDVVLLETVQRQLGVIVHVDLERVPHELLADRADLLREGGAEHHHLFIGRGRTEDLLHIGSHV